MRDGIKEEAAALRETVDSLEVSKAEIARRHDCTRQFVFDVLSGRSPCPPPLRAVIEQLIEERKAQLAQMLRKVGAA